MSKKKPIDPKRSEAAKRGWITRRLRQGIGLTQKQKRSLAAKKGWETRRKKQRGIILESKTSREKELEDREKELTKRIAELEEQLERQKSYSQRLEKGIEKLKIKEFHEQVPPSELVSYEISKDPEAAKVAVAKMIEERLNLGWPFYQSLRDVWEEMRFTDQYSDIADIREAWEDEGTSPDVETYEAVA